MKRASMSNREEKILLSETVDNDLNIVHPKLQTKVRFQINGSHVLDDFSFSLYYHCKTSTQLAHTITIPIGYFSLICMLSILSLIISYFHVFELLPSIIWALPLTVWYTYLFPVLGILWGILLFGEVVAARYFLIWVYTSIFHTGTHYFSYWIYLLIGTTIITAILLSLLPAQHYTFEKASPARRPYEAFVTTPLLLSWILLNKFVNYRRDELGVVFNRCTKWNVSTYSRREFVAPKL